MFHLDQIPFFEDASLIIVSIAKYRQEKLKFGCSPTLPNTWSSLSSITLSKNTSATSTEDIVQVSLQLNSSIQNKTTWYSENWQNRAMIIKQFIHPLTGSGIEFDIPTEHVLCSDEGTYHCTVRGVTSVGQSTETTTTGTVQFTGYCLYVTCFHGLNKVEHSEYVHFTVCTSSTMFTYKEEFYLIFIAKTLMSDIVYQFRNKMKFYFTENSNSVLIDYRMKAM